LSCGGWGIFRSWVEPDIANSIRGLHGDVRPLVDAISRYPQTMRTATGSSRTWG
jgi:hypothetical protein